MKNELVSVYVDDDAMSCTVMEMLFRHKLEQKNLTVFHDSADFMTRINALAHTPDFFMLDIHIAPNSGFEMLSMLRADERFQNAKIVAVTASVMVEEVELLKDAGFDGALGKPVDPEFVGEFMDRILAGKHVWHI